MIVYWIIAIVTVLINLFPTEKESDYPIRLFVSLIPLFLYGAFRVDFGLDYVSYLNLFEDIKIYGDEVDERMEIGYLFLNKILPSFRSLLVVQTLLLCTAYFYLFKWYIPSRYAWLGFLLLFLNGPITVFFMLNGIRNGIAISILILSTYFIHKKRIIPFVLLVFIAYLFHKSILLIAPIVLFVANGKVISKKNIFIWISVMILISVSSSTIILDYVGIFINTYFERYSIYMDFAKEQDKGAGILISFFSFLEVSMIFLILKNKQMTADENMITKLMLLFFLSFLMGPLNIRMSQNFSPFFIAGSITVINKGTNKLFKAVYVTAIFSYLIYALKLWFESPYFSYDTYHSFLFS